MSRVQITGLNLASVKDYGAKGDGIADDTAAIQAAINDAISISSIGGVFFPPGNYQVSIAGLSVTAAIEFAMVGAGKALSTLRFLAQDQGGTPTPLLSLGALSSYIEIKDIAFDGNRANLTNPGGGALLDTGDTTNLDVHDCAFQNSAGRSILAGDNATNATDLAFRDLNFSNSIGECIVLQDVSNVAIRGCTGASFNSALASFVTILSTANAGNNNSDISIRNNSFNNIGPGWSGIRIQEVNGCRITGNEISGGAGEAPASSAVAIEAGLDHVFDVAISSNALVGSFLFSVFLETTDGNIGRFSITNNEISDDIRLLAGGGVYSNTPNISGNWGSALLSLITDLPNLPNRAMVVGGAFNDGVNGTPAGSTQWAGPGSPEAQFAEGTYSQPTNPADTQTVTLGVKTYTFQTVLTNVDGNVQIGATAADSMNNLIAAITLAGTPGVDYAAAMTANTSATATKISDTSMLATALVPSTAGNAVATSTTVTGAVWGAATLLGGVDGVSANVGDMYQDLTGSEGKATFIKQAGSGNIGWSPLEPIEQINPTPPAPANTAPVAMSPNDSIVRCDVSGGGFTQILPPQPDNSGLTLEGRTFTIIEESNTLGLFVAPAAGNTINGVPTPLAVPPGGSLSFVADGDSNWLVEGVQKNPRNKTIFFFTDSSNLSSTGDHRGVQVGANQTRRFEAKIPEDFTSLVSINLVVIPANTNAAANIDLNSDYAQPGQLYNTNSESDITSTYALTANIIDSISLATVTTGISANDLLGIRVANNAVTGGYLVLGIELVYN